MKRIPRMSSGGVLTPQSWDMVAQVIDANFRECQIQPGKGVTISNGTGGQIVSVNQVSKKSSLSVYPFDFIGVSSTTCQFQPGTIAGLIPTNMFATLTFSTSTSYLLATCATSGQKVTAASLSIVSSVPSFPIPTVGAAPSTLYIVLGTFTSGSFTNLWQKSISATPKEVMRVPVTNPTAFQLPFTSYWDWSVS